MFIICGNGSGHISGKSVSANQQIVSSVVETVLVSETIYANTLDATTMHLDSILIYGHCFSLEPDPRAIEGEKINNIDDIVNSVIYFNGDTKPNSYISITDIGKGISF